MSALPHDLFAETRPYSADADRSADGPISDLPALGPLLTVAEVADYLRVSEMTVYRLITKGSLVARRIGRGWRVLPRDLDAFIEDAATVTG